MTKEELLKMPFYIEDISGSENTVSIKKSFSSAPTLNIEYSTDGSTWNTKTMNENTTPNTFTLPANGKLYLRGVNNGWGASKSYGSYNNITCSGEHNVAGNIMSLLYGSEFIGKTEFPTTNSYVLKSLFSDNYNLINAQELQLPATKLTTACYREFFSGCTNLTTAPELPATTLADSCYEYMFNNCTSLTTTPELPATTLVYECYQYMFNNCTSLTTTPELPATTLAHYCYHSMFYGTNVLPDCSNIDFTSETLVISGGLKGLFGGTKVTDEDLMDILPINPETNHYYLPVTTLVAYCYQYMFQDCKSLTTAPELPATTLADGCYYDMFAGCTSLTTAPELPATTLDINCYNGMFAGCTSLTTAPELPATTLTGSCYSSMFSGCSSLTTAPELPATTLDIYCYNAMFQDCKSLTTAPELPATTLADGCYSYMFNGCSKLKYIKADFINYSNNYSEFSDWVFGVSSTGTFIMNPNANYNPENIRGVNGIPTGWVVSKSNERVINVINNNDILGTVTGSGIYSIGETATLTAVSSYKGKFVSWSDGNTELTRTIEITEDLSYETTYTAIFKEAPGIFFINESENTNILTVSNTDKVLQYSIDNVNWNNIANNTTTSIEFNNNVTIKGTNTSLDGVNFKNSELTLIEGNIMTLLHGDNITIIGNVFPEGSVNTFKGLFKDNVNLVDISKLELPETTVEGCYSSMFQGCSSLVNAPTLPAIELSTSCYSSMFQGCSSLVTAPELPATELTSSCYNSMFQGCSKLNLITADFINYSNANNEFTNWVDGVAAEGTFKYNKNATFNPEEIRGVDGIPEGWLVKDNSVEYFYIEDISGQNNMIGITLDNVTMDFFAPQPSSDETTSDNPLDSWNHLNVEYSYDGIEWQSLNILEECMKNNSPVAVISLEANTKVYLRGINRGWNSFLNNIEFFEQQFGISYEDMINQEWFMFYVWEYDLPCPINTILCMDKVKIGGNILTLKYGEEIPSEVTSEELEYSFMNLFNPDIIMGVYQPGPNYTHGINPIVDASELILPDVVGSDCYNRMFYCCSLLNQAPQLPAMELAPYCYREMFDDCTSLVKAPELPATTLASGCYFGMFKGCSKLNYVKMGYKGYIENGEEYSLKSVTPATVSEELPSVDFSAVDAMLWYVAETGTFVMAAGAQYDPYVFVPETWLLKSIDYGVEILPLDGDFTLTISKKGNIQNPISLRYTVDMSNWEYITEADLPYHINTGTDGIVLAGDNVSLEGIQIRGNKPYNMKGNIMCLLLGESGKEQGCTFPDGTTNNFKYLFLGDKCIKDISGLVFTETTVDNCYHHMFTGCTGITTLPQLPATNLSDSCYHGMFMGCDGLTKVVLPEAYLAPYAYSNMFLGCEYLNNVTVTYKEDVDETNYKGWLNGVSVNGKFSYKHTEEVDDKLIRSNYYVPSTWGIKYRNSNINYFYIEDISGNENIVSITKNSVDSPTLNIEYSTDGSTWTTKTMNSSTTANTFTCPANGKLYLRGVNDGWCTHNYYTVNTITCSGQHNVGGNIMSLLYGSEFKDKTTFPNNSVFQELFRNNTTLVNAQDLQLPATTLTQFCYYAMFLDCSSLTTAPELPATTLANYCYSYMFEGCSKLNYIKADFINYSNTNGEFTGWVSGVSETGTFVMNPNATYNPDSIRGGDGIPTGWTVITK